MKLTIDEFYDGRGESLAILKDDCPAPVAMVYKADTRLAKLLAASPEMQTALERLLDHVEPCGCDEDNTCPHPDSLRFTSGADSAIPEIKSALAKARGDGP